MPSNLITLDANGCYRLAFDEQQWIVERMGSVRRNEGAHSAKPRWRGVWFVGSEKSTLRRYFKDRFTLTPEAEQRLDMLPDTFREFRTMAASSTLAA